MKKIEYAILALFLCIGVLLTIWIYFPSSAAGTVAEVRVGGQVKMRLPLNKDTTATVTVDDTGKNVIKVASGVVYVIDANCNDHYCQRQKGISKTGESIVCLPHRLSITIVGGTNTQPDGIAS